MYSVPIKSIIDKIKPSTMNESARQNLLIMDNELVIMSTNTSLIYDACDSVTFIDGKIRAAV